MKIFKTLAVALFLAFSLANSPVCGKIKPTFVSFTEYPAKTVIIKHPAAANVESYFAAATIIRFEIYKVGTKADIDKVVSAFIKDENVESANIAGVTGDYQAFEIVLKAGKGKAWFVSKLKKAGLNSIRINNDPVVELDKL